MQNLENFLITFFSKFFVETEIFVTFCENRNFDFEEIEIFQNRLRKPKFCKIFCGNRKSFVGTNILLNLLQKPKIYKIFCGNKNCAKIFCGNKNFAKIFCGNRNFAKSFVEAENLHNLFGNWDFWKIFFKKPKFCKIFLRNRFFCGNRNFAKSFVEMEILQNLLGKHRNRDFLEIEIFRKISSRLWNFFSLCNFSYMKTPNYKVQQIKLL